MSLPAGCHLQNLCLTCQLSINFRESEREKKRERRKRKKVKKWRETLHLGEKGARNYPRF
jgi:hypothetical protein